MKKYLVSIVVFIFLVPVYALAGEYVLVKGEGIKRNWGRFSNRTV